jgi:universal stress protein A
MSAYVKILVAIDLSEDSNLILQRARAVAGNGAAQLHLIHVIEPLSFAYGGDIPMDFSGIQDEIYQQATQQLGRFAEANGIDEAHRHIVMGRPEVEIHNTARELEADLIVVGSHGRHGLALIMGSTATGVLHGARRDVLAVRVGIKD